MSVNHSTRSGGKIGIYFSIFYKIKVYCIFKIGIYISIFYKIKVYCIFALESPHRGDSNEYIQYTIFNTKKKTTEYYPKSAAMGFFQGTQERIRNSRGERAIGVRAIEVLLYLEE